MTAEKDVQVARKKTFFLNEVFPYLDTVKGLLDWAPVMGWGTPLALLANVFQNSHSAEALGGIPLTKRFPFWRFADLPKTARSTYITVPRRSVIKEIQTRIQRSYSGRRD